VAVGGTFHGNPLSMATALATIRSLAQAEGAPLKHPGIEAAAYTNLSLTWKSNFAVKYP
jgi:glutamate-1-semialdehyde aminotransferase